MRPMPGRRRRSRPHSRCERSFMATVAQAPSRGKRAALSGETIRLSDFAAMNGLYLEDLKVGMSAMFGKTVTEADIMSFAGVSGDTNPIHLHDGFARTTRF